MYEYHCNKNKIAAFILKKISRSTLFNQNKSFDLFDKVFGHFIVVKWQSILQKVDFKQPLKIELELRKAEL